MKYKRMHINNYCLFLPPFLGTAALVAHQEGYEAIGALWALVFLTLLTVGAATTRIYWIEPARDKARLIKQAIDRQGYWIDERGSIQEALQKAPRSISRSSAHETA